MISRKEMLLKGEIHYYLIHELKNNGLTESDIVSLTRLNNYTVKRILKKQTRKNIRVKIKNEVKNMVNRILHIDSDIKIEIEFLMTKINTGGI